MPFVIALWVAFGLAMPHPEALLGPSPDRWRLFA